MKNYINQFKLLLGILLNLAILVCLLVFCKDKNINLFYLFYILKYFFP